MAMPAWSHVPLVLTVLPFVPTHLPPARPAPALKSLETAPLAPIVFVGPTRLPVHEDEPKASFAERTLEETEGRVMVVGDVDPDVLERREAWLKSQGHDLLSGGRFYAPPSDNPDMAALIGNYGKITYTMLGSRQTSPGSRGRPRKGAGSGGMVLYGAAAEAKGVAPGTRLTGGVDFRPRVQAASAPAPAAGGAMLVSYDPSAPYGQRYTFQINGANGISRTYKASPLIFDLGGRGLNTGLGRVAFDILGGKKARSISDVAEGVGLLAIRKGDSGLSLFGDRTDLDGDGKPDGHADGFEALAAFVKKAGIEKDVLGPEELARLEKHHGLAMKVGGFRGKLVSLKAAGVCGLTLSAADTVLVEKDFDGLNNDLQTLKGAVFARCRGGKGRYADLWLEARPLGR